VDERGVTHYSDRPVPGATRVELATSNRAAAPTSSPAPATPAPQRTQPAGPPYRNFEIWQPAEGEAIINTGGQVTVNVRVDPSLEPGHTLFLYLDGRRVEGFPPNASSYDLKDVPRGTHRVLAVISDGRGARVQEAGPVNFTVRQESIAQPPVGPALRPPPKPRPTGGAANKLPQAQPSYAALNGARAQVDPATNAPVRPRPAAKPGPKPGG
jgi:hypothetical protein